MEHNLKRHRQRLRAGYMEVAEQIGPNAFVSLVTNDHGTTSEMTRLIGKFCGMVDRALLGHKWHTLPAEQRLDGFFVIEHTDGKIHAHGLLKFPGDVDADLPAITASKWNRLTEAGSTDFQSIHDAGGCAAYCTKEMTRFLFDPDQVVLARQFMKH